MEWCTEDIVELGRCSKMVFELQTSASIQPRTASERIKNSHHFKGPDGDKIPFEEEGQFSQPTSRLSGQENSSVLLFVFFETPRLRSQNSSLESWNALLSKGPSRSRRSSSNSRRRSSMPWQERSRFPSRRSRSSTGSALANVFWAAKREYM